MWKKIRKWFISYFATRKIIACDIITGKAELRAKKYVKLLAKREKQLKSLQKQLYSLNERLSEELEDALAAQKRYEEALSAQQSELKILREVTLPTLTSQHKLLLQRYDAEIAIQIRRQVAASPHNE